MIFLSTDFAFSPSRKLKPFIHATLFVALPLAISSAVEAAPQLPAPARPAVRPKSVPAATSDYVLGANDVIDITVSNHADLNTSIKIRPDGRFTMSRAGEVLAQGKTASVLAKELERRLARTLNNARVQVSVKEASPRLASIDGAVKTAGSYPIKSSTRVLDLVAAAGGLSTKSTRIKGRILRTGQLDAINFDVAQAQTQPDSANNVLLRPDDRVFLDTKVYLPITVTGSVAKNGTYVYDEDLTVVSLLAQAGNANTDAALSKAFIQRGDKTLPLDLTPASLAKPAMVQFRFEPGDTLVVPQNQMTVTVNGQVAKPNFYTLPENTNDATLLKVLAQAGGPIASADLEKVTITRNGPDGQPQIIPVNAEAILQGTSPDNIYLQPKDLIYVPLRDAQVSVVGPVTRPGNYQLTDNMTLISLIVAAGNPTASAGLSRAYVLRDGKQIPVNLRGALIEGKTDEQVANFRLQNRDLLVIPDTTDQVSVTGLVTRPGSYNLDDNLTVASLLARAGNPTQGALLSRAYVQRGDQQIPLDLRSILGSGTPNPEVLAFRFQGGDQLVIPENQLRFSVLGQVTRPGAYPYPEIASDATILKALGMAGGPIVGSGTKLKNSSIIRPSNAKTGQYTVIPVDLSKMLSLKADGTEPATGNILLQPGDTLFIPQGKSGLKVRDLFAPLGLVAALGGF